MNPKLRHFHWLPRIIGILAILFISLFALDAFEPGLSVWEQLGGFFIRLIPSFVLTAILALAWKREFWGGIVLALIGIGLSPWIFFANYQNNHSLGISLGVILAINFPFILAGGLFMVSHILKKNRNQANPSNRHAANRLAV